MVCVPCIVIPALLYVWHRWLQPWIMPFLRLWWTGSEDNAIQKNDELLSNSEVAPKSSSTKSGNPVNRSCPFASKSVSKRRPLIYFQYKLVLCCNNA